jgi:hypothetical protein
MENFENFLCIKDIMIFKKGISYELWTGYKGTYVSPQEKFDDHFQSIKEIRKQKLKKLEC